MTVSTTCLFSTVHAALKQYIPHIQAKSSPFFQLAQHYLTCCNNAFYGLTVKRQQAWRNCCCVDSCESVLASESDYKICKELQASALVQRVMQELLNGLVYLLQTAGQVSENHSTSQSKMGMNCNNEVTTLYMPMQQNKVTVVQVLQCTYQFYIAITVNSSNEYKIAYAFNFRMNSLHILSFYSSCSCHSC